MEYKPTTLPQYWPIKSRQNFDQVTVQSGHILLFTQDGQSLTAKLSNGSFVVIGGSGGDCPQCPSVQSVQFYKCVSVGAGQTVQAVRVSGISSPSDLNTIFYAIPGLNRHFQSETGRYFFEYTQDQNQGLYRWFLYDTQTEELCAQAFWMQPVNYQSPAQIPAGEWNFFISAPQPSITDASAAGTLYYQVSGAYPDSWNGRYLQTNILQEGRLVYQHSDAQTPRYLFWANGMCCIGSDYSHTQDLYNDVTFYLQPLLGGWSTNYPQTVTAPSSVILTLQPGGSTGWTGYKAVQSSGTYTFQSSITSGLSYGTSIPAVGNVYNDGATVQALMLGSGGWQITDATATAADIISGKKAYISGGVTTGTIPVNLGSVITPGAVSQTISAGQYLSGAIVINPAPEGSSTDFTAVTAAPGDVLSGSTFYDSTGVLSTGTIPAVSASIISGAVVVPSGYISSAQSFQYPVWSQVTATPATVVSGASFYDSTGELIEGDMSFTLGSTIRPTTSSQTVSAGVYLSGNIVIQGDTALVGSNIVSGVSIFGESGTHVCQGVTLGYVSNGVFYELSFSGTSSVEVASSSGLSTYSWNLPYSQGAAVVVYNEGSLVSSANVMNAIDLYGSMYVSNGGTANSTTVNSSGSMYVYAGGTANSTTINSSGRMYVSSSGTANSNTVNSGGYLYVSSGGMANNNTMNGGYLYVSSGGMATDIVENGGYVTFWDGANVTFTPNAFSGLVLSNGQLATVHSGTTAVSTTINSSGRLEVRIGGIVVDTLVSGVSARLQISDGGVATNTIINSGGRLVVGHDATANSITVNFSGSMYVSSGGTANSTTVSGGRLYISSGGTAMDIDWTPCVGSVTVAKGGYATFVSQYSGVYFGSADQLLSSAAVINDKIVLQGSMYVFTQGVADNITINDRGIIYVYGGVVNSTMYNGGSMYIGSGGTANSTTVNGVSMYINDDGMAINTTVNAAGRVYVTSGGTVNSITVSQGGSLAVDLGGTALNVYSMTGASVTGYGTINIIN